MQGRAVNTPTHSRPNRTSMLDTIFAKKGCFSKGERIREIKKKRCNFSGIMIEISPKFDLEDPFDNNSALVQIMAWRRTGSKPLSEQTKTYLLLYICNIRPQWITSNVERSSTIMSSEYV